MGDTTKIQWADATWSPWWGCQRISPACGDETGGGCYAEAWDKRVGGAHWGPDAPRRVFGDEHWKKLPRLAVRARREGRRLRVFPSMCDPFEERLDLVLPRANFFALIEATPELDHQLLTKRPENVLKMVPAHWLEKWPAQAWIGATAENRMRFKHAVRWLRHVPAATKFLSCEPLLEELGEVREALRAAGIAQVIVGGESGPQSRPFNLEWARSLQRECAAAESAYFFKQAGANPLDGLVRLRLKDRKGGELDELPADLHVRQWPEARGA